MYISFQSDMGCLLSAEQSLETLQERQLDIVSLWALLRI